MIPEAGDRRVFKDCILTMPLVDSLYAMIGWSGGGAWRVIRVNDTHCFFEKFAGSERRKLLVETFRTRARQWRAIPYSNYYDRPGDWLT